MKKALFIVIATVVSILAIKICCHADTKTLSPDTISKDQQQIERYYFVKGMTCSGCVFGVKKALQRTGIEKPQILDVDYSSPDPENKVGHAKVKFSKDQYKGEETDCKIVKEIRKNPGYIAYWDKNNTDPCKLGTQPN